MPNTAALIWGRGRQFRQTIARRSLTLENRAAALRHILRLVASIAQPAARPVCRTPSPHHEDAFEHTFAWVRPIWVRPHGDARIWVKIEALGQFRLSMGQALG